MDKLSKSYTEYQAIDIDDKQLIKDFLDKCYPVWEEDIINFKALSKDYKVENISTLSIWSYIGLEDELEYNFYFNDGTYKKFYIEKEFIYNFLVEHDLLSD